MHVYIYIYILYYVENDVSLSNLQFLTNQRSVGPTQKKTPKKKKEVGEHICGEIVNILN